MIYESGQWISDLDEVIDHLPELGELGGKSVLVTGAAGLICSAVVDVLFRYNDTHNTQIHIFAAGRCMEKISGRFGERINRLDFSFVQFDASKTDNDLQVHADYIIHGAGNAFPDMIMKEPVETMLSNFLGINYLLEYAKAQSAKRILFISSSEIYEKKDGEQPYGEHEYGYIDLLNPRNAYSVGKRAAETLCASYAAEYGIESVIVRPGHIYGPTASPQDNRVSSAWAHMAARGEDIVIKSDGAQLRSYCYCLDCASAILTVLIKGVGGRAYNISNPDSIITIRKMAELLASTAGVKLKAKFPTKAEKKGFNPMSNSSLDSKELLMLGWRGLFNAERGLSHTVEILREMNKTLIME